MSTLRLNLGIVAGILLLVPLSAGVAGQAPRPNSGGSEVDGMRGQDRRARQAAPLQVQSSPPSVTLSFDDSFDMPGYALRTLITALKANPNARTFRASWSLLVFNNQTQTTILYDRRTHRLRFYSLGDGDVLGTRHDHFPLPLCRSRCSAGSPGRTATTTSKTAGPGWATCLSTVAGRWCWSRGGGGRCSLAGLPTRDSQASTRSQLM